MKRRYLANLTLSASSVLFVLLCGELILRLFSMAPDLPRTAFVNGVVKYEPSQRGINKVRNESEAEYRINANGWNSAHDSYNLARSADRHRIAIIGDSYIAAFQVGYDQSIAEQLETVLGPQRVEVYRYGIPGAPMSQYLHMLRREVSAFQPDLVVIVVVHNDFSESYLDVPGVYASSFMKLELTGGVVQERQPQRLERHWYDSIRERSASWRFLAYRWQVRFTALLDLVLGHTDEFQANIKVSAVVNKKDNEVATQYVFEGLKQEAGTRGIELLIVMDGDRQGLFTESARDSAVSAAALSLNVMAARVAGQAGIHFIDLHPVFQEEYARRHLRFNTEHDGHWNVYGHQVVADAIARYLREHQLVSGLN